jgi:riboflavin transporter FmnP
MGCAGGVDGRRAGHDIAVMIPVNYYWALGAYGIPQAAHLELVRTAITPFNLARSAMSTLLTFPVFLALKKPLGKIVNQK